MVVFLFLKFKIFCEFSGVMFIFKLDNEGNFFILIFGRDGNFWGVENVGFILEFFFIFLWKLVNNLGSCLILKGKLFGW